MVLSIHDFCVWEIPEHVRIFTAVLSPIAVRAYANGVISPGFAILRAVDDPVTTQSSGDDSLIATKGDDPVVTLTTVQGELEFLGGRRLCAGDCSTGSHMFRPIEDYNIVAVLALDLAKAGMVGRAEEATKILS